MPLLRLHQVCRVYGAGAGAVHVLRGVDLEVRPGEYVAIVGPSGAGKSTMLNILGCLDRPTSGEYWLEDVNVADLDDRRLSHLRKTRLGFVFQSFQLIPHLSVLENVEMPLFYARRPRRERRRRCAELIDRVGLSHRLGHTPSELSGGECQRAAIARALANDPALVLADEPTGNLDTSTSEEILRLIRELHEAGRTILMITHDRELSQAAPRRVTLRDGRVLADALQEAAHVPA